MTTRYRRRLLTPWANCILNGFALVAFIAMAMKGSELASEILRAL